MNRRQFLGSLGVLTAALGLRPRTAHAGEDRCLVVHFSNGGWDPTYVFEPRVGSTVVDSDPESVEATVGDLTFADAEGRPGVRSFLETYGHEVAFVNGLAVGSISHAACTRHILTGSRRQDAADLPTMLAAGIGSGLALPHLVLSGPRFPGTLGEVMVPLSPTLLGTVDGSLPQGTSVDAAAEARARAYLQQTTSDLAASASGSAEAYAAFGRGLERRAALDEAISALTLPDNPTVPEQLVAGVAALSMGLSSTIIVEGSLPERATWDSHQNNHTSQDEAFENLFYELGSLAAMLSQTDHPAGGSLLERTTVLAISEMGRTPVYNNAQGKDHWPYTSAMLFGAGVAGGRAVGATDEVLVSQPTNLTTGEADAGGEILTPAHLIAGLLETFDLDPAEHFPDTTPFTAPFAAR